MNDLQQADYFLSSLPSGQLGSWGVDIGRNLEVGGGVSGLSRDEQNKPKRMQNIVFLMLIDRASVFET